MKIKGRFIAVLAAVGLLAALLPALPTGAAAGEVTLSGGEKGQYFSDKGTKNIVTIHVEDDDLSPARVGNARFTNDSSPFNLEDSVIGGEMEDVQEFDGGLNNPVCDHDADDPDGDGMKPNPEYDVDNNPNVPQTIEATAEQRSTTEEERANPGCDLGDAEFSGDSNDDGVQDDNEIWQWTITLKDVARDKDGDAVVDEEDITVVVNGQKMDLSDDYTFNRVDADNIDGNDDGGGISQIELLSEPRDAAKSVAITTQVTEYVFGSGTPLRLAGTEIHYGTDFDSVDNQVQVDTVNSSNGTVSATSAAANNAAAQVVTFVYNVEDTEKEYVNVTTTTSLATGVDRKLTGVETTAQSSLFESKIAIVESSDYTQIVNQAKNSANDNTDAADNVVGVIEIRELNQAEMLGADVQTRLEGLVGAGNAFPSLVLTDAADKLIPFLIPATHSDTLTVTYADDNPRVNLSKTATVDLAAPDVTLVSPTHNLFSRDSVLTLIAEVVDAGSGVTQGDINLIASFGLGETTVRSPIQDGYRVTNVPDAVNQGAHEWAVTVMDKVGNVPDVESDTTKAVLGAAPDNVDFVSEVDKPYKFAVDTSGPTLISGETGVKLLNEGVTTGDETKREKEGTNDREWLRVNFSLGDGTAPLDVASVQAADFTVDDAAPLDVKVNSRKLGESAKGSLVYLRVGELQTNARPTVRLVGEVRDMAGNPRTDGSITNVADGLAPVLTVTPSAEIANEKVVITVTSSERLGLNPDVGVTTTKPVKGTASSTTPLTVALQTGALTTWTATFTNPSGAASRQYVVVKGSDQAGKGDTVGDASTEKDIISFQVDDAAPGLKFEDAEGEDLEDTKQQEGAVWVVAQFDDDEHFGSDGKSTDDHRTVEVTSVSLTDSAGAVIASDAAALFGGLSNCTDHEDTMYTTKAAVEADASADPPVVAVAAEEAAVSAKCDERTLAINLTPGTYNIAITAVDAAGNSKSGNVDFEVGARKPFELDLKPGVNLISVPGWPVGDSGNLNIMFEDEPVNLVTTYDRAADVAGQNPWMRSTRDPETGLFTGDITTLQPGVAYFVTADARTTVDLTLQRVVGELPPTLQVRFGYNAIGYWSIQPTPTAQPIDDYLNSIPWTVAYSYDPTPGRGWEVLRPGSSDPDDEVDTLMAEPGKGYLVFTRFDATLTP